MDADQTVLKNIPTEYKNLYESLSPSAKTELFEQAKGVKGLDTLSGVRNFFQTRDYNTLSKMNALNSLNESITEKPLSGFKMVTDLLKPY